MDFLKEITNSLIPKKEEYDRVNEIFFRLKKKLKIKDALIELGGSAKKDTWLRGNHDIDVYAKFDLKRYKDKDIASILAMELKKHFKITTLHGSRNYYQITIGDYTIEVIPIIEIKHPREALNLTDISPFHCKYVNRYNKCREIRMAKAFCRANNCYGAESYIGGFSGYVLEILTIHYGSFLNLVKNASKWGDVTHIGNKKLIKNLNMSKKIGPLILIDPVDCDRNAAAALTREKYDLFIKSCKAFLARPAKEFFIEKKFDEKLFIKKHGKRKVIIIEAKPLDGKKDVVGAKLLKCFNYIKRQFILNEFKILDCRWNWSDKAKFYFVFNKDGLSKTRKHYGPPTNEKDGVNGFIKKWGRKNIKKEGNYIYINVKRDFTNPEDYARYLTRNDKNVLSYVRSIKLV